MQASFDGGAITSDGGSLLLSQADRRLGLRCTLARALDDPRQQSRCTHSSVTLLRQRIYGLALGFEDPNDHQTLRNDRQEGRYYNAYYDHYIFLSLSSFYSQRLLVACLRPASRGQDHYVSAFMRLLVTRLRRAREPHYSSIGAS